MCPLDAWCKETHVTGVSQAQNSAASSAAKPTVESTASGVTANGNSAAVTGTQAPEDSQDNTSSCVIELRAVWFNFAAPPHAPITRKIDFTR
jgi:hypothetical protein